MKTEERCGLQDDRETDQPTRAHEEPTQSGDGAIREAEIRCTPPGPIEDQELMPEEHRFGDHRTGTAGTDQSGGCRQQMEKKDGQVAHATILSRRQSAEMLMI
jgi:hypothetical protein